MDDLREFLVIQQKMAQTVDQLQPDNACVADWDWVLLLEEANNYRELNDYLPVYTLARNKYSLN